MPLHFQEIDVDLPVSDWGILLAQMPANDFIVVDDNRDRLIWFTTNYTQLLARNGGTEIAPIYGELANDHSSFVYQVNFSLPCSYELGDNPHALYDLLLNFETEPDRKVTTSTMTCSEILIWMNNCSGNSIYYQGKQSVK